MAGITSPRLKNTKLSRRVAHFARICSTELTQASPRMQTALESSLARCRVEVLTRGQQDFGGAEDGHHSQEPVAQLETFASQVSSGSVLVQGRRPQFILGKENFRALDHMDHAARVHSGRR